MLHEDETRLTMILVMCVLVIEVVKLLLRAG